MDIVTLALAKKGDARLQAEIDSLTPYGRNLSNWDCTTGLPVDNPPTVSYAYQNGDFFMVTKTASEGGTNYKPSGTTYTGVASTTVETGAVTVGDYYDYDGANQNWRLRNSSIPNKVNERITYIDGTTATLIVNGQLIED